MPPEFDPIAASRKTWRLRLAIACVLALGLAGLSVWFRTGHAMSSAVAIGFVVLLLVFGVLLRLINDDRVRDDPQYAARTASLRQATSYIRARGGIAMIILAVVLLEILFLRLLAFRPVAHALQEILGPLTRIEIQIGAVVVSFALVLGAITLYRAFMKKRT